MEEKFWLPEEQKVEQNYLLNERGRNRVIDCGLFLNIHRTFSMNIKKSSAMHTRCRGKMIANAIGTSVRESGEPDSILYYLHW